MLGSLINIIKARGQPGLRVGHLRGSSVMSIASASVTSVQVCAASESRTGMPQWPHNTHRDRDAGSGFTGPYLSLTQLQVPLAVSGVAAVTVMGVLGSCGYASLDWDEGRNGSVSGELKSAARAALAETGEDEWLGLECGDTTPSRASPSSPQARSSSA